VTGTRAKPVIFYCNHGPKREGAATDETSSAPEPKIIKKHNSRLSLLSLLAITQLDVFAPKMERR